MQTLEVPAMPEEIHAIVARIREALERSDFAPLEQVCAPDVFFDAVVPHWRFQLQGTRATGDAFAESYRKPTRIVDWHAEETATGALVEVSLFTGAGADERFTRQAHILDIADGKITEYRLYCSGMWPMETVERHRVEEPLIRP